MKPKKLLFLEKVLRKMAESILNKYKPTVVAVTGSVGKTTTKDMIGKVLSGSFSIRKSFKNYNNEVGIPLTILGVDSENKSFFGWFSVFFKWAGIMFFPSKYPEILVLEMGADRPGDLEYLCRFVPVKVGVLTEIGKSHLEYFKTQKNIAKEKGVLLKSLPAWGAAIFNNDNDFCRKIGLASKANKISFGFEDGAAMRATDILFSYENRSSGGEAMLSGIIFKLTYNGKIIPIRLDHGIGKPVIYSALAAFAVGVYFKMNPIEIATALKDFVPAPGRMNVIPGIKRTVILDDSYNSAPNSTTAALETFERIKARRKIVILGDMLELGSEEEKGHRDVGKKVAEVGADIFVSVGKRMDYAADEFRKISKRIDAVIEFSSPIEAGKYVQEILNPGDLILIKGSQGMRMEMIVEELMAEPERAGDLLVRQDERWKTKEFVQP